VNDAWGAERRRLTELFDAAAETYRERFADELERKPFDRELLDRVARDFPAGPVMEVGAGPGQIGRYLADRGVPVVESDASLGQLHEARILRAGAPLVVADLAALPVRPGSLAGIVAFYCLIFGPAEPLTAVLASWREALQPGGLVVIATHSGSATTAHEWEGHTWNIVQREADALRDQVEAAGLGIEEQTVREPYDDESTRRGYVVARRR
jgi:SAM-dependent methyltransferase